MRQKLTATHRMLILLLLQFVLASMDGPRLLLPSADLDGLPDLHLSLLLIAADLLPHPLSLPLACSLDWHPASSTRPINVPVGPNILNNFLSLSLRVSLLLLMFLVRQETVLNIDGCQISPTTCFCCTFRCLPRTITAGSAGFARGIFCLSIIVPEQIMIW
jgi:hypothetical protein